MDGRRYIGIMLTNERQAAVMINMAVGEQYETDVTQRQRYAEFVFERRETVDQIVIGKIRAGATVNEDW